MIATSAKTTSWPHGTENSTSNCDSAFVTSDGEEDAEREPERGADERGDHALVPHHAPRLPARHADRAEHPELARPLEHGEDERVDHAEER